jgi:alpha-glucosidase
MATSGEDRVDVALGTLRARSMALLLLALPGAAYIYSGQELGLPNVDDLPDDRLQDPIWERTGHTQRGRDGCRIPMPWTREGANLGFTAEGVEPWLPIPRSWAELSVAAEADDPDSMLTLYSRALRLRRASRALGRGALHWVDADSAEVLALDLRGPGETVRVLVNLSTVPVGLPDGEVLLTSSPTEARKLPGSSSAWVRLDATP